MAHHRPDLLKELLAAIDDPRNDIYLHIDKKSLPQMRPEMFQTQKARLRVIPSIPVYWGGFSQIQCELNLLSAALDDCHHSYYHLLTGVTYPLRSQDYIHSFFQKNAGAEFIESSDGRRDLYRLRYYWFFKNGNRPLSWPVLRKAKIFLVCMQEILGVDRFKKYNMELRKGLAYWSITENLATYIVSKQSTISRMMHHTYCCDEVFAHTLAWNSRFRENIKNDCLRLSTWAIEKTKIRPKHSFKMNDIRTILSSDALFALKFESDDGIDLIRFIQNVKWQQNARD